MAQSKTIRDLSDLLSRGGSLTLVPEPRDFSVHQGREAQAMLAERYQNSFERIVGEVCTMWGDGHRSENSMEWTFQDATLLIAIETTFFGGAPSFANPCIVAHASVKIADAPS